VLVDNQDWDRMTTAELKRQLNSKKAEGLTVLNSDGFKFYLFAKGSKTPQTLAFHTSAGSQGLMHITELLEKPRGIKFRFKSALSNDNDDAEAKPNEAKSEIESLIGKLQRGELAAERIRKIVAQALAIQGDATKPWNGEWGDFLELSRAKRHLTDEDFRRYAAQSSPNWKFTAVGLVRNSTGELQFRFNHTHVGGRVAKHITEHGLEIRYKLVELKIGKQTVKTYDGRDAGLHSFAEKCGHGSGQHLPAKDYPVLARLPKGKHTATLILDVDVYATGQPDKVFKNWRLQLIDEFDSTHVGVAAEDGPAADSADEEANSETAAKIIAEYLGHVHPPIDRIGKARSKRLRTLERLNSHPKTAVVAVANALPKASPAQRAELAETLRHFPSDESAKILVKLLDDSDAHVRRNAVHTLRLFSRRVDRSGFVRKQRGEEREPLVAGLVPHLIKASADSDATVRMSAIYALADAKSDEAVRRLRACLMDPDAKNQLKAACFLTEFGDHTGADIIKASLPRLRDPENGLRFLDAGMVIASLERITKKSFGPIPAPPEIFSNSEQAEAAKRQFEELLAKWDEFINEVANE
jgi:hypothetical protein